MDSMVPVMLFIQESRVVERIDVSTMVPVTAIPYAAARLLECSKLTITITTAT